MARQFERATHWASSGEKLPNPPLARRPLRKRKRCQEKPVARLCDSSSDERASCQGADTDDASVTPMRENPRTPSEVGCTSVAESVADAVVESDNDLVEE